MSFDIRLSLHLIFLHLIRYHILVIFAKNVKDVLIVRQVRNTWCRHRDS